MIGMQKNNTRRIAMDETVKTEIGKLALGYDLKYKINPHLMTTYLAPEYLQLRRRHSELHFVEFIEELVRVRAQARKAENDATPSITLT
jgi:hypothetical protein